MLESQTWIESLYRLFLEFSDAFLDDAMRAKTLRFSVPVSPEEFVVIFAHLNDRTKAKVIECLEQGFRRTVSADPKFASQLVELFSERSF